MPIGVNELGGYDQPDENEIPFFCLLQDDSLITKFTVEADTLLKPLGSEPNINHAHVIITVTLKPYHVTVFNLGFG